MTGADGVGHAISLFRLIRPPVISLITAIYLPVIFLLFCSRGASAVFRKRLESRDFSRQNSADSRDSPSFLPVPRMKWRRLSHVLCALRRHSAEDRLDHLGLGPLEGGVVERLAAVEARHLVRRVGVLLGRRPDHVEEHLR